MLEALQAFDDLKKKMYGQHLSPSLCRLQKTLPTGKPMPPERD